MKFLLSDVRAIMAQVELLFAPVGHPVFVAPVAQVIGRLRPSWSTKNMNNMESRDDDTPGLAATRALGVYAEAPIGPGPALDAMDVVMDEHASRQLATAILKHIPKKLRELVDFEVDLQAGVFLILLILHVPSSG